MSDTRKETAGQQSQDRSQQPATGKMGGKTVAIQSQQPKGPTASASKPPKPSEPEG